MRSFDLVVIGSGPGGYSAAIRASQLGLRAAVVEKGRAGGVCTNRGCIPTKAILASAEAAEEARGAASLGIRTGPVEVDFAAVMARSREVAASLSKGVEHLLRKNGVELVRGAARIASPSSVVVDGEEIGAGHVLVATGTTVRELPAFPFDGERILSSDQALLLDRLPPSVAIIGGGAIGVEFGYAFRALGADVTIVEMLDQLLPRADADLARELAASLGRKGVRILFSASAKGYDTEAGILSVEAGGRVESVPAAALLVAAGRAPATAGLGLDELGVALERGFVKVDGAYRTSVPSILAVGDVIGGRMLAHEASAEGVAAAEAIAGREARTVDPRAVPWCVYCRPEAASVGLTEAEAAAAGTAVKVGRFPFLANGRARAAGHPEGFVKVVASERYGEVLGVHAIGHGASELVAPAVLALSLEATWLELGRAVFPHPTLGEAVREAALAAFGEAIDI